MAFSSDVTAYCAARHYNMSIHLLKQITHHEVNWFAQCQLNFFSRLITFAVASAVT